MMRRRPMLKPTAALLLLLPLVFTAAMRANAAMPRFDQLNPDTAGRYAQLALDCVEREYPNLIHHVLAGDDHVAPPRVLTPAFRGCYDWHSAVHGHWLLARLARQSPETDFAPGLAAATRRRTR